MLDKHRAIVHQSNPLRLGQRVRLRLLGTGVVVAGAAGTLGTAAAKEGLGGGTWLLNGLVLGGMGGRAEAGEAEACGGGGGDVVTLYSWERQSKCRLVPVTTTWYLLSMALYRMVEMPTFMVARKINSCHSARRE